jgi:DNA-binding MarR family transcriptional regulator
MKKMNNNELASGLRVSVSRLVKVLRSEVRNTEHLSLTERSTLSMLYQNSCMLPSELAAIEKVTGQSMSQIIKKLNNLSYIRRTQSQEDKRKVIIAITEKGKEFIELKRNKSQEWLAKAISEKVSDEEKEILERAIPVLTKLVE